MKSTVVNKRNISTLLLISFLYFYYQYPSTLLTQFISVAVGILFLSSKYRPTILKSINSNYANYLVYAFLISSIVLLVMTLMKKKKVEYFEEKKKKKKEKKQFTEEQFKKTQNIQHSDIDEKQFKKIENFNTKKTNKPLKVKNALLLKKHTLETFQNIMEELSSMTLTKEEQKYILFDRIMLYFRKIMESLTKENRMIYVGILLLLFSIILSFIEFSL